MVFFRDNRIGFILPYQDPASGGQVWKDEGASIVAHIDVYDYLMANPSPEVLPPDLTWSWDQFQVELGGIIVEQHYLGLSHGNGMTAFVLPQSKVQ